MNLKECFEQNLKVLVDEKMFQEDGAGDICLINLMLAWIPITIEEISKYEQLDGEERQKYLDELYMRKLCEWLEED